MAKNTQTLRPSLTFFLKDQEMLCHFLMDGFHTVGRNSVDSIFIKHNDMKPNHCVIRVNNGKSFLFSGHQNCDIMLNGEVIYPSWWYKLCHNDVIMFGVYLYAIYNCESTSRIESLLKLLTITFDEKQKSPEEHARKEKKQIDTTDIAPFHYGLYMAASQSDNLCTQRFNTVSVEDDISPTEHLTLLPVHCTDKKGYSNDFKDIKSFENPKSKIEDDYEDDIAATQPCNFASTLNSKNRNFEINDEDPLCDEDDISPTEPLTFSSSSNMGEKKIDVFAKPKIIIKMNKEIRPNVYPFSDDDDLLPTQPFRFEPVADNKSELEGFRKFLAEQGAIGSGGRSSSPIPKINVSSYEEDFSPTQPYFSGKSDCHTHNISKDLASDEDDISPTQPIIAASTSTKQILADKPNICANTSKISSGNYDSIDDEIPACAGLLNSVMSFDIYFKKVELLNLMNKEHLITYKICTPLKNRHYSPSLCHLDPQPSTSAYSPSSIINLQKFGFKTPKPFNLSFIQRPRLSDSTNSLGDSSRNFIIPESDNDVSNTQSDKDSFIICSDSDDNLLDETIPLIEEKDESGSKYETTDFIICETQDDEYEIDKVPTASKNENKDSTCQIGFPNKGETVKRNFLSEDISDYSSDSEDITIDKSISIDMEGIASNKTKDVTNDDEISNNKAVISYKKDVCVENDLNDKNYTISENAAVSVDKDETIFNEEIASINNYTIDNNSNTEIIVINSATLICKERIIDNDNEDINRDKDLAINKKNHDIYLAKNKNYPTCDSDLTANKNYSTSDNDLNVDASNLSSNDEFVINKELTINKDLTIDDNLTIDKGITVDKNTIVDKDHTLDKDHTVDINTDEGMTIDKINDEDGYHNKENAPYIDNENASLYKGKIDHKKNNNINKEITSIAEKNTQLDNVNNLIVKNDPLINKNIINEENKETTIDKEDFTIVGETNVNFKKKVTTIDDSIDDSVQTIDRHNIFNVDSTAGSPRTSSRRSNRNKDVVNEVGVHLNSIGNNTIISNTSSKTKNQVASEVVKKTKQSKKVSQNVSKASDANDLKQIINVSCDLSLESTTASPKTFSQKKRLGRKSNVNIEVNLTLTRNNMSESIQNPAPTSSNDKDRKTQSRKCTSVAKDTTQTKTVTCDSSIETAVSSQIFTGPKRSNRKIKSKAEVNITSKRSTRSKIIAKTRSIKLSKNLSSLSNENTNTSGNIFLQDLKQNSASSTSNDKIETHAHEFSVTTRRSRRILKVDPINNIVEGNKVSECVLQNKPPTTDAKIENLKPDPTFPAKTRSKQQPVFNLGKGNQLTPDSEKLNISTKRQKKAAPKNISKILPSDACTPLSNFSVEHSRSTRTRKQNVISNTAESLSSKRNSKINSISLDSIETSRRSVCYDRPGIQKKNVQVSKRKQSDCDSRKGKIRKISDEKVSEFQNIDATCSKYEDSISDQALQKTLNLRISLRSKNRNKKTNLLTESKHEKSTIIQITKKKENSTFKTDSSVSHVIDNIEAKKISVCKDQAENQNVKISKRRQISCGSRRERKVLKINDEKKTEFQNSDATTSNLVVSLRSKNNDKKKSNPLAENKNNKSEIISTTPKNEISSIIGNWKKSVVNQKLNSTVKSYEKPQIMFTGIEVNDSNEKIVIDLGGVIVEDVNISTHLVTDKVRRTVKFLCCIAKGIPIVTEAWLKKSSKQKRFIDHLPFILHDKNSESTYNFSLPATLQKAKDGPLLQGWIIHVTKNVTPGQNILHSIIEAAGGTFWNIMPSCRRQKNLIVISCEKDKKDCHHLSSYGVPVVDVEFLFTGLLQYELNFKKYNLIN